MIIKIKEIREKKGITQLELAEQVGITQVYLSYIENGHKTPTLKTLQKLAKALDVDIGELIQTS